MSTRAASAQRARGAAPTTPEYREEPLWWEGVSFPEPPASALPDSADVVIIGAGYTGLAAALELCRHGVRPLVLDCRELGRGASGRNAGMVHGGLRLDRATLQRRHGAAGVALHEAATAAHDFIARLAPQVAPDCDYRDTGWLYLAHRQVQLRRLRSRAAAGAGQSRFSNRMLSVEQLREETAAAGFHGGLLSSAGSSLHPGWYLAGLARAAMHAGATVRTG